MADHPGEIGARMGLGGYSARSCLCTSSALPVGLPMRCVSPCAMSLTSGFLFTSIAALTGTPITGALLDKFGFYAPIIWSGVTVLVGSGLIGGSIVLQRRAKNTWKV
jgi:hypothetical protein